MERFAPVPVGVLNLKRVLPSLCRSNALFPEALIPPRPRRHPNSAIGNKSVILKLFFVSTVAWRGYCATARTLHRSPTGREVAPPASAPLPRSHASWHSFRRVQPASIPSVLDPCPVPAIPVCSALPVPASSANSYRPLW